MSDTTKPLNLCAHHPQEWKHSHYDSENCDYCKLKAENERLKAHHSGTCAETQLDPDNGIVFSDGSIGETRLTVMADPAENWLILTCTAPNNGPYQIALALPTLKTEEKDDE